MKEERKGYFNFIMFLFIPVVLTVFFAVLFSCVNVKSRKKTVTVTGVVIIQGNEPHTMVILEEAGSGEKRYMLEGELVSKLKDKYQHRTVTIVGYITGKANPPLFPEKIKVIKILNH